MPPLRLRANSSGKVGVWKKKKEKKKEKGGREINRSGAATRVNTACPRGKMRDEIRINASPPSAWTGVLKPLSRILEKRCNQPVFVPFRSPSFPHFLPRDGVEDDGAVSLRAYIRCVVYHRVFLFFFWKRFPRMNYVNRDATFFSFHLRYEFFELK